MRRQAKERRNEKLRYAIALCTLKDLEERRHDDAKKEEPLLIEISL